MKYITFKKLSIKNFLSVGEEPVTIDFETGLHVITGINKDKEDRRNGVGKSTIADAIHFAIFGDTLRELKKEFIINNKIQRGCQVTLELEIKDKSSIEHIRIVRKLKPTKCFLYINKEDRTRDSIPNTTRAIFDMLSCTPDIFQNCVIMTVNNTIPFMAKKKVEKRKFIEGIFNLQVFGEMLLAIRQDLNIEKNGLDIENARFSELEKSIITVTKQKQTYDDDRKRREDKLKKRQASNEAEMKQIQTNLAQDQAIDPDETKDNIEGFEQHLDSCDEKITSFNKNIATKETDISYKNREKKSVGTDDDVCPTCLRTITIDDRDRIQNRKGNIDKEISILREELLKLEERMDTYSALKAKLKSTITIENQKLIKEKSNAGKKDRLQQLEDWNSEINHDLNNNTNELSQLNESFEQSQNDIKELQSTIKDISNKIKLLETVRFIVSEEGVKSYIVKKILNLFNSKLGYYLKRMDANCQCTFNEYFEEEIINEKGKTCSYFNFSGAERKNIDLACLFAFMDIRRMQGDVAYNFSVYDELFDSSLDERGVELVLDILKERVKKYNECVMIISHRKESTKAATGNIIFLEKENGITRKVDYMEYNSN